jgi:hypothetical protein
MGTGSVAGLGVGIESLNDRRRGTRERDRSNYLGR